MGSQAFDAKRTQLFWLDPDEIVVIGWDTKDGSEHELYDERAKLPVDEKLATNIAFLGKVLEPISVRKNGEKAEVVYGRQRVKAAREANKQLKARGAETVLVPCQLDRGDDGRLIGMMISENEHRQGDTPITLARKLARYMDHGHTEEDAAAMMGGVTIQTVRATLSLLDLDRSVQKMVEDKRLSPTAASKLAKLERKEQKVQAEKLLESGNATVAAASRAVKTAKNGDGAAVPVAPGKRTLRKVLEANVGEEVLSEDFVRGIRFCLGDLSPTAVKGLTALMEGPAE